MDTASGGLPLICFVAGVGLTLGCRFDRLPGTVLLVREQVAIDVQCGLGRGMTEPSLDDLKAADGYRAMDERQAIKTLLHP